MKNKVWLSTPIVLLAICLALPQWASAQLCNAEAHRWVAAHESELPRTYEDFSQFPLNYRRAIYSVLGSEKRAQLWQEQIERALQRDDLTNPQRDIVLEAAQLVTPELFASLKDRNNPDRQNVLQRVAEFEKRARKALGPERAGDLLARIGPADVEFGVIKLRDSSVIRKSLEKAVACSCSTTSDYCNSAFHCSTATSCNFIRDECGIFWTQHCNGLCHPD